MQEIQQSIAPDKKAKIEDLGETIFDLLDTGFHQKSDKHLKWARRAIANSIYDAPYIYSGKISKEAKEGLVSGKIKREKLCKEHPISRTLTAEKIITCFDSVEDKYEAKTQIVSTLETGCKVNLVLGSENVKLAAFQKDYSLSEEECYQAAGIELVDDEVEQLNLFPYVYRFKEIEGRSIPEMADKLQVSKYRIRKMIESGEIERELV